MNKILMDGDKLYYFGKEKNLDISGFKKIYIKDVSDYSLDINLKKNSTLEIYIFANSKGVSSININQSEHSKVTLVHTFIINDEYTFKYKTNISGDKNINDVFISGVSKGKVTLDIDGVVNPKTNENELNENIKVLTINGDCFVSPMLHISALNVLANHNTAISNVRENELFYLESKGIDRKKAIDLIENSYTYGYLLTKSKEFLDYVKNE